MVARLALQFRKAELHFFVIAETDISGFEHRAERYGNAFDRLAFEAETVTMPAIRIILSKGVDAIPSSSK